MAGTHSAAPVAAASEYHIPIASRTAPANWVQSVLFGLFFNAGIICLNLSQFLFLPLYFHPATRPTYERAIAYTKKGFGILLVAISQLFAPTRIVLSFTDGQGNPIDASKYVKKNAQTGEVEGLHLPDRSVWISNHQVYLDWLYLWCIALYADLADSIIIILKASLKKVPFVGWGMQFFRFIFLARNWQTDRLPLAKHLSFLAERSHSEHSASDVKKHDDAPESRKGADAASARASPSRLLLLIFPEGTLRSKGTVAQSEKFREKLGLKERLQHTILPRSTGLFFCLRSLAADIDDLYLVDFTIGYPGVGPENYGEQHYTLRSVYMQGVPPPRVHINVVLTPVRTPLDGGSAANGAAAGSVASATDRPPLGRLAPSGKLSGTDEWEPTAEERDAFDAWLRARWTAKDALMDRFQRDGDFVHGAYTGRSAGANANAEYHEIPVQLRSPLQLGHAFVWGLPLWAGIAVGKLVKAIRG